MRRGGAPAEDRMEGKMGDMCLIKVGSGAKLQR